MAHTTLWSPRLFFYPIGNTPATSLTEYIPPDQNASILSLGCGDPRNTLYTLALDEKNAFLRRLDFTFCDMEPAVLARNVFIYTMLLDQSDSDTVNRLFKLYCDICIDKGTFALLVAHCSKLLDLSTSLERWQSHPYGALIQFSTMDSMFALRRFWRRYLCEGRDMKKLKSHVLREMKKVHEARVGGAPVPTAMRSAGIMAPDMAFLAPDHFIHYWSHGVTGVDPEEVGDATHVNPTLLYSSHGEDFNLHYGTDPLVCFHLAPALALWTFARWCSGFHRRVNMRTVGAEVQLRFFAGNAIGLCKALLSVSRGGPLTPKEHADVWGGTTISFLDIYLWHSPRPAPVTFNIIDTSNVADHMGFLNILLIAAPLLRRDESSVLFTHSLSSSIDRRNGLVSALETIDIPLPLLSIVLGVIPERMSSSFTSHSMSAELLLSNLRGGSAQLLEPNSWRVASISNSSTAHTVTCNPTDLAASLFSVYLKLFRDERLCDALEGGGGRLKHYTRETFVCLLSLTKERFPEQWSSVVGQVLDLIKRDRTLVAGIAYYQDLSRALHVAGLVDILPDPLSFTPSTHDSCFQKWQEVPLSVYVVLVVPRQSIQKILDDTEEMSTPCLQCEVTVPRGHNAFFSIQPTFGSIEGAGTSPGRVGIIHEDPQRWKGTSDLIVYFPCPAWIFVEPPLGRCVVSLNMCGLAAAMEFGSKLGMRLTIWSTTLADSKRAFILRDRPRVASQVTSQYGSISTSPAPVVGGGANDNASEPCTTAKFERGGISSFSVRTTIVDKVAKTSLASRESQVTARPLSNTAVRISFMGFEKVVHFPYPVDMASLVTRIARKSSYLEIEARIARSTSTSANLSPFPIVPAGTKGMWALRMHYITLDVLSPLRDPVDAATDRLRHHFSLSLFEELRRHRAGERTRPDRGLTDLKESLYSLFGQFTERHKGKPTVVEFFGPPRSNFLLLLFVDCMRMDSTGNTVIADACALVVTQAIFNSPPVFMAMLRGTHDRVRLTTEEICWWKQYLPTAAERCRTWNHKPNCEYTMSGVSYTIEKGGEWLCGCGRGKALGGFAEVKEWTVFKPFVTRVALGMPFPTSSLADMALDIRRRFDQLPISRNINGGNSDSEPLPDLVCAACGHPGKPKLQVCSACKSISYCSSACQKAQWKEHKVTCARGKPLS
ncbi:hypothetical protein NMY22_g2440 [Coprinellus aureogranulatus]|nr:hypothetical protein NMY22_g2440 [Coprinellus aureogranulatus]